MATRRLMPAFLALTIAASGLANEEIALANVWKVQAAKSCAVAPDEASWGSDAVKGNEHRLSAAAAKAPKGQGAQEPLKSAWYEQRLEVPASWEGSRAVLDFRRIEGDAIVFFNGVKIGELLRPGGEIEVTQALKPGTENVLRVFLTKDYAGISRGFDQDILRKAARTIKNRQIDEAKWNLGITAPVSLVKRAAPASITGLGVQTSWRKKEISFEADLDLAKELKGLTVRVDVFDQSGKKALSVESPAIAAPAGKSTNAFSASWSDATLWELDKAYLYTAKAHLLLDGKEIEEAKPESFGFREIWVDGRKIFLNGHEARFRLSAVWNVASSGAGQIDFMRLIGYNAGYIQANPGLWWGSWNESPLYDEELLNRCDESGYALFLPSPSSRAFASDFVKSPELQKEIERETKIFVRRYRNRPAILGWMTSMNGLPLHGSDGDLYRFSQSPAGMGHRFTEAEIATSTNLKATQRLCEIAKSADPSRLAFAHAEGGVGEIASANFYLNFVPLQERAEWPMKWSADGEMPFMMVETGQPHIGNFWKGKRYLVTEYLSIYFGEEAYLKEPASLLEKTVKTGLAIDNDGQGDNTSDRSMGEHPLYWDFQRLFVRESNRSWRSWDVNGGWSYWVVTTHYGLPPWEKPNQGLPIVKIYNKVPKGIDAKPDWANPNFEIHSQANKPMLAYLAGWPRHTDKAHSYYEGERVEKAVSVVWDGPGSAKISAKWTLTASDGKTLLSGSIEQRELQPGETKLLPISFEAPTTGERTDCALTLAPSMDGKELETDSFKLDFRPRPAKPSLSAKTAIIDPAGLSSEWLAAWGADCQSVKPGDSLDSYDLLVIGREALKPGTQMPFKLRDVERGLKILVLEQKPEVWNGLGFRTTEAMPRIAFPSDAASPLVKDAPAEDFRYWRGSSTLLPEGRSQPSETPHAPKWTNTHGISSSTPQIPRVAGFVPALSTEFDLDYSPLLEWRYGKGMIVFCSLDLTGRVGADPSATELALRLLKRLDSAKPEPTRKALFAGDEASKNLLASLGVDAEPVDSLKGSDPASSLLVLGKGHGVGKDELAAFAKAGGKALCLPQTQEFLSSFGIKTEHASIRHADAKGVDKAFRGVGPKLLRWRDSLDAELLCQDGQPKEMEVFADGVLGLMKEGSGSIAFCQIEPSMILDKCKGDKDKAEAVDLSPIRIKQLLSALLNACEATPSKACGERLLSIAEPPSYRPLGPWQVQGPFAVQKEDGEAMLATKAPAEEAAIAGKLPQDSLTVAAKDNGYVNLAEALGKKTLAVACASCVVDSDYERDAVIRVGCDWRMALWVNGKEVFRTLDGKNKPNAYRVNVHFNKGRNIVAAKFASGSSGFSFYADVSGSGFGKPCLYSEDLRAGAILYGGALASEEFDPYLFRYW